MIRSDRTWFRYRNIANDDRIEWLPASSAVKPSLSNPMMVMVWRMCIRVVLLVMKVSEVQSWIVLIELVKPVPG